MDEPATTSLARVRRHFVLLSEVVLVKSVRVTKLSNKSQHSLALGCGNKLILTSDIAPFRCVKGKHDFGKLGVAKTKSSMQL